MMLILLGLLLALWAMASNKFFAATVRVQSERGHTVVSGGLYRYVRHPGYLGGILCDLGSPLVLGSLWRFVPAGITLVATILRTALEDGTLQEELIAYQDYTRQVRHCLILGVW